VGVGLSELVPGAEADPADLVDTKTPRLKAAEDAMEQLRARFGPGPWIAASCWERPRAIAARRARAEAVPMRDRGGEAGRTRRDRTVSESPAPACSACVPPS
jgi:hypothetical protein